MSHSGNNIGHAWASNNIANTRLAFNTGIAIRHKASTLLMTGSNMLNICVFETAIKLNSMYARDAKYGINAVRLHKYADGSGWAGIQSPDSFVNFDADGLPLEGDDQLTPLVLEFQLDARGYGKRRKFGFVDIVRVKFDKTGAAERFSKLRPGVFGEWYDRALDSQALKATSKLLPDGRRRFSVAIPRSYLYRHEYALGEANSLFGVNAHLAFAKAGQPDDPYPPERNFALVKSGLSKHTAESLAVLELVPRSTGRWSVRLD